MIGLEPHAAGAVLPVRAHAAARHNSISGVHHGRLKVSVTQAPEKGKANKAIIRLLSDQLLLKRAQIELRSGVASNHKSFLIRDITVAELAARVNAALGNAE